MEAKDFKREAKLFINAFTDWNENIENIKNVLPNVEPGFLLKRLPKEFPENPEPFNEISKDFDDLILKGLTQENHPHYNAYFPPGFSYPGTLGEIAISGLSIPIINWDNCPAGKELETIVSDWYAKAVGLSDVFLSSSPTGGGFMPNSASEAILISMIAARSKALKELKGSSSVHESVLLGNLVAYGSKHANCALHKANVAALTKMRWIDVDEKGRMRVDLLKETIIQDINSGLTPYYVMATLGTTGTTAFDDLYEIGIFCEKIPSIWFHVDGAYGLNGLILPEFRKFGKGLDLADSLNVNAFKMLLVNFDSTVMWVKDLKLLDHSFRGLSYKNYGLSTEQRWRAIKIWFVFRSYGLKGLRAHVRNIFNLAKLFESLVQKDERFEVGNEVITGLVNFRLRCSEEKTKELLSEITNGRKLFMVPSEADGKFGIRYVVSAEKMTENHILEAWEIITSTATKILCD